MSEQTRPSTSDAPTSQGGGCRCGCGGHRAADERAAAPSVAQPLGAGYQEPASSPEGGVVPGRKPGNLLGLRDVSAVGSGGGCGCGGHGQGHGHGAGRAAGRCGCGGH